MNIESSHKMYQHCAVIHTHTNTHIVRPNTKKKTENPPPLPTTMPPMGQVIKTTSTFQAGPNNTKREFHTQSSTFRPAGGQIVTGSRTVVTSSTISSPPMGSISGNWQSPRYGNNTIGSSGGSPSHSVYGVNNNNNHQFIQHSGANNNSFLANERSAAASPAG